MKNNSSYRQGMPVSRRQGCHPWPLDSGSPCRNDVLSGYLTLWEGRFRSCPIQEEAYLLACQRYIELNPVRAGMVAHPAKYRWSSYRANAQGETDALLKPHPLYGALGLDDAGWQAAYRELFRYELEPGLVDEIRRATNGNFALGNESFAVQVSMALGRRAAPGKSGRPRKVVEPESNNLFLT